MTMEPFARDKLVDKPGIIGARWWHASLADEQTRVVRRDAIRSILIAGGVIAGFGALLALCVKAVDSSSSSSSPTSGDVREERKTSLEMQKAYGWSFGAVGEALVFDGDTSKPFDPSTLPTLADDMRPGRSDLAPYYQPTLFQSPYAVPTSLARLAPEEQAGFKTLADALRPIATPDMNGAYARGKSLASLFAALLETGGKPTDAKTALVVDLPGHEAIAFAAGAASMFDPVFLFDNWPHPRGVVRSQETLSAAAYYQPLFKRERAKTDGKSPMFVLDRRRLTTYADDAKQFDNRYVAKLPSPAATMRKLGGDHVLYVVRRGLDTAQELDDLNDDFVGYAAGGIDVKALATDAFFAAPVEAAADAGAQGRDNRPPPAASKKLRGDEPSDKLLLDSGWLYYGGSRLSHFSFFLDYPWVKPPRPPQAAAVALSGKRYRPVPRKTLYSSGTAGPALASRPSPPNFGTVPVAIAIGTGLILGARYSRSGSWNRSSGGSGSFG